MQNIESVQRSKKHLQKACASATIKPERKHVKHTNKNKARTHIVKIVKKALQQLLSVKNLQRLQIELWEVKLEKLLTK